MVVKKTSRGTKAVKKAQVSEKVQKKVPFWKSCFYFKGFFGNLVGKVDISDKPLNWLSIIFLIAFDIFIFINLLNGLDSQRQNIESPYARYDYRCSDLFEVQTEGFEYNQLLTIKNYKNYGDKRLNENAPFYKEGLSNQTSDTLCRNLEKNILAVQKNENFIGTMKLIKDLTKLQYTYEAQKNKYENNYSEFREDYKAGLAGYDDRISDINLENVRGEYEVIIGNLHSNELKIENQIAFLNHSSGIDELRKYIEQNKKKFDAEKSRYVFWYPVYVTLMEMILIFPLFFIASFLYSFALKRKKRILAILASNLSLITGIFTFYILIKVVYWILPKKFLANIFEYLASMKLLAIWNYLLVIFGVLLFGFLIFLSQRALEKWKKIKEEQVKEKELLNKERIQKERFWAKVCIDCNTKLLPEAQFCSNCGVDQYRACKSCKHKVPKAYKYCDKCGK